MSTATAIAVAPRIIVAVSVREGRQPDEAVF